MTMPDLGRFVAKRPSARPHYVYVFHSLISTHMAWLKRAYDDYDSILCGGPHHVSEIRATEKYYGLPPKALIECGHVRLDHLIRYTGTRSRQNSESASGLRVVIASTYGLQSLAEYENGGLCTSLIRELLREGIHVTLRPHWLTVHSNQAVISQIESEFDNNPHFELETELTSFTNLLDSDVLVCDLSGIALEYALGLLKPVLYVDMPPRVRNSDFNKIGMPVLELTLREKTGAILPRDEWAHSPRVIAKLHADREMYRARCEALRNKWVFNVGKSAETGAAHLSDLVTKMGETRSTTQVHSSLHVPEVAFGMKQASVTYGGGTVGLHATNLEFERGKFTVLLGPSGAGKSTLLRSICGLVPLTTGEIIVANLGSLDNNAAWRVHQRLTAMIFQLHQLIGSQTVLQNVLVGRLPHHPWWRSVLPWPESDKRKALECLERVGLLKKALERVESLSGGEKQRVGIARALAQETEVILADEPVASLDPASSEKILSFLKRICEEDLKTVIISLHQVDYAREFADRIIGISDGRVMFDGTVGDLSLGKLRVLYGLRFVDQDMSASTTEMYAPEVTRL